MAPTFRAMSSAPNTTQAGESLPIGRLTALRAGYAFMAVGLAVVKWPLLPGAAASPVSDGVVTCLLTALSLLAVLGLRHPVRMLPILLFEVAWKTIWIAVVALPDMVAGDLDTATRTVLVNCSLVVVIAAVIPWRHVWTSYVTTPAEPWLRTGSPARDPQEATP